MSTIMRFHTCSEQRVAIESAVAELGGSNASFIREAVQEKLELNGFKPPLFVDARSTRQEPARPRRKVETVAYDGPVETEPVVSEPQSKETGNAAKVSSISWDTP